MANNRNDFPPSIIEVVKRRAAFICSNPDCKVMTVASSDVDDEKVLYIGKVAHISAASNGGPRYDANISEDQRSSIANAIFLCSNCADMIDKNNGKDFLKELLVEWKQNHEKWVREQLNKSPANILKNKPEISLANSSGSVIQINEKGDNVYVDKKIINQAPTPTLKILEIVYQDSEVKENLTKKNKKLLERENTQCYKTFVRFEYKSDNKKDNIDFKINSNTILHVDMKILNEISETSAWSYQDKIKGIRFFNPSNGIYEMTFYTSYPILDIWKFFRFAVNNTEVPIQKINPEN